MPRDRCSTSKSNVAEPHKEVDVRARFDFNREDVDAPDALCVALLGRFENDDDSSSSGNVYMPTVENFVIPTRDSL